MGSTRHAGIAALTAATFALAGCGGSDDAGEGAATAPAVTAAGGGDALVGEAETAQTAAEVQAAEAEAQPADAGGGVDASGGVIAPARQVPGQALAIEASAAVQADDVRDAVGRLTAVVAGRGGMVAAADVDYDPVAAEDPEDADDSRATLVLSVPPSELPGMADALEDLGTVTSFDQFAEDVSEQLADVDSRLANLRASVERVRALLAQAVDIDGIVRLEAELTARETELERTLASQRLLEDRVAMATLTVDLTTRAPPDVAAEEEDDDPGVVAAFGAGWDAFTTGLFSVVLVLAAVAPFAALAAVVFVVALIALRALRRRASATRPASAPSP